MHKLDYRIFYVNVTVTQPWQCRAERVSVVTLFSITVAYYAPLQFFEFCTAYIDLFVTRGSGVVRVIVYT